MRNTLWNTAPLLLLAAAVLMAASAVARETSGPSAATGAQQVVHVVGIEGVGRNVKGKLAFGSDSLEFTAAESSGWIPIGSIEDICTGQDSRQSGGKAMAVAKMGIPYGGARVVSLFAHEKFDSLTVEYRDSYGALHAAIFTLRAGQAAAVKKRLILMGARTSTPAEDSPAQRADAARKDTQ